MASIRADLSLMPLADFLRWHSEQDLDGVLTVDSGLEQLKFLIHQGAVVRAETNSKDLSLGQFLIANRTISEDTMRNALQQQQNIQSQAQTSERTPIGEFLIQNSLISEEQLQEAVNTQIEEVLGEAATWTTGVLVFESKELQYRTYAAQTSVPLERLCRLIEEREDTWYHFRRMFRDTKARLEIGNVSSDNEYQLDHLEDRILSYAAFGMTVEAIRLEIRGPAYQTYRRLQTLEELGFINIVEAAVDEPPTLDLPVQNGTDIDQKAKAQQALDANDYRLAMSYAKVCLARDPNDELAKLIFDDADRRLQEQLRSLLPSLEAVPQKLITTKALREKRRVSAKEHYLLTRINGIRDIESIVRVAPMKDIDAYKLFEQLQREGVIEFSNK